ncbi:MAG: right-handed parallel beta-helix repeat-containing protein, partial [Armatimonadetes bacterium]|nr:right-handed parallel beta-helix repeat-containing protein [Armatimonadota bacterium]
MKSSLVLLVTFVLRFSHVAAASVTLYVSPSGNDTWSGKSARANAAHTDGPLASLTGARDATRRLRSSPNWRPQPVNVSVRGGTYRMNEPFVLTPEDSGTSGAPVTYSAYQGEQPVFSGGKVVTGWRPGPGKVWTARAPGDSKNVGEFQQLFINGQRRTRARTPNAGYFFSLRKAPPKMDPVTGKEVAQDSTAFVYSPGNIKPWADLNDINVVVYHSWETARHRIKEVDEARHIVYFTGPSAWHFEYFGPKRRFYVENYAEALDAPGEWYLDRKTGVVSYSPMPGEDLRKAEVVAPVLRKLLEFRGEPELGLYVEHVTLRGLTFQHQDWALEPEGHSDAQAVWSVAAAVMADGARDCTIENCEIAHVGEHGLWFRRGCKNNRIVHNRIHDLGVGGLRIGETVMARDDNLESSHNLVDNNHIFDGGHVYAGGVGLWVAQSSHNVISHNEIHDFNYSGMSIGWNWGNELNRCHHNTIEYNHVHHVMNHALNDGGAIYTLGTSPGSIIRNNVFHDVWPYDAIGWGIYLDAACNQYLVENNIVYNTLSGGLMYHNGGHEHVIQNNIFAFTAEQALWPYWDKRINTFRRNIVYLTQGDLFIPYSENSLRERLSSKEPPADWDNNVYFNPTQPELKFLRYDFAEWQSLGVDQHSVIADPQFQNATGYDFRLKATSPALKLGFKPIDISKVGLYGDPAWVNEAKQMKHPPTVLPPVPTQKPFVVNDGFEDTEVGEPPNDAYVSGQEDGAAIRVTDEQAAEGKHSLKFTDAPNLSYPWEPHIFYRPHFIEGNARQSFDLRLEKSSLMYTEWRDTTTYPDCIGPSLTFEGTGKVTASGKLLTTIPVEQWIHIEIECALGKKAPRTYSVAITSSGGTMQRFENIAYTGKDFVELHWLGFVSTAENKAVFFVDNVKIGQV